MNARFEPLRRSDQGTTTDSLSGFLSEDHRALAEQLAEVLTLRRGLTVFSGPDGVGKSCLLQQIRAQLPPTYIWCAPTSTPRHGADLYAALLATPTATPVSDVDGPALAALREALVRQLRERGLGDTWTILMIDDADALPSQVLAELDHLAGLEPMVQIVLVACSPEFLTSASESGRIGLAARVRERVEMGPLEPADWTSFVAHAAAGDMQLLPFDPDAIGVLGSVARGIPGPMLALAAKASDAARQQWDSHVTKEFVRMVSGGVDPAIEVLAAGRPVAAVAAAREPAPALHRVVQPTPVVELNPVVQPTPVVELNPAALPRLEAVSAASAPERRTARHEVDPFRDSPGRLTIRSPDLLPVLSAPHCIQAEWFRVLQLRLEDWVRESGGGAKAILVTGANSNAGKSLVAVNLALLWAHNSWQRVLLIDGDMRRPQFDALFEIPRRPGFADVLAGRATVDEASALISETGLHVLPAGRPGNPRQLANPDHVTRVFDAARQSFDLVIVDSPPLSAMVDSRSMASSADGVLMVVRSGETRLGALKKTLEYMPRENLIGAVVNGGDKDEHSAYAEYQRSVASG